MKDIMNISIPNSKKYMQYFFGKINFVLRFMAIFSQIGKPLKHMIKKDGKFKWISIEKESFDKAKASIVATLVLHILDFSK
jgi:hypothetical protein